MQRAALVVLAIGLASAGACSSGEAEEPSKAIVGGTLSDELRYEVAAADAMKAAEAALEGDDFKVERRHRDECGGKLVARREDGHRATVTIHAPDRTSSEIAVYVEPADRGLVGAIQTRIGEKLSLKKAQANLLGESTLEASYAVDLETALAAVDHACRAMGLEPTLRHREEGRARVEVRDRDRRIVRFLLSPGADPGETRFVLSCDPMPDSGEKEFLRRVRREMERHLFPPAAD